MKILFLAPYPAGESPSQRYRFEHYLPFLHEHGITYNYKTFIDLATWEIIFKPGHTFKKVAGILRGYIKRSLLLFSIRQYDYVFIHREAAPIGPPVLEWIIAKLLRRKIIYDYDDAIWIPSFSEANSFSRHIKWFNKVKSICKWSYRISAGNEFLANYAKQFNSRVSIVPTVVNTERIHNELQDQQVSNPVIGWTGTLTTLKFLNLVMPALLELEKKVAFEFVLIANKDPMLPLKNYRFIKWSKEREREDLLSIHVGIMPLSNDDLSKGKCGFKAIQYMSLGIPAVVSDVGVNPVIVDNGINGFVCDNLNEWRTALEQLLANQQLRTSMGINARKKIEAIYSVKATKDLFIKLFD